jgi:hypothetical protein
MRLHILLSLFLFLTLKIHGQTNVTIRGTCPPSEYFFDDISIKVYKNNKCTGKPTYEEKISPGCSRAPLALSLIVGPGMIDVSDCNEGQIAVSGYSKKSTCKGLPDIAAPVQVNVCHRPVAGSNYFANISFEVNPLKQLLRDATRKAPTAPSPSPFLIESGDEFDVDVTEPLHSGIIVVVVVVPLFIISAVVMILVYRRNRKLGAEKRGMQLSGFELFEKRGSIISMNPLQSDQGAFSGENPLRLPQKLGSTVESSKRRSSITYHLDRKTGRRYSYNLDTGETKWLVF